MTIANELLKFNLELVENAVDQAISYSLLSAASWVPALVKSFCICTQLTNKIMINLFVK
jgi:hypothetical protein